MINKLQNKMVWLVLVCFTTFLTKAEIYAQGKNDSIKQEAITLRDMVSGVEERVATAENNLEKLTKIKLSGYIQAQWQFFENPAVFPN
ncbi:MAG: hypothetical protein ABIK52_02400, partial [Bacteroidota bacterium]